MKRVIGIPKRYTSVSLALRQRVDQTVRWTVRIDGPLAGAPARWSTTVASPSVTSNNSTSTVATSKAVAVDPKHAPNLFLDNIGTIFLTAIGGIIAWLVRSYLNGHAKTAVREAIEAKAAVDPVEISDVQCANRNNTRMTPALFLELVRHVHDTHGYDTTMTYPDFVQAVRASMAVLSEQPLTIEMGHVLDRIALSIVQNHTNQEHEHGPDDDTINTNAERPVAQWWTLLSLALPFETATQRMQALYELLTVSHPTDSMSNDSMSNLSMDMAPSSVLSDDVPYAGGAMVTPSLDQVVRLVQYLQESCQLTPDAQIVMDANQTIPLQHYAVGTPYQLVHLAYDPLASDRPRTDTEPMDWDTFQAILTSQSVCAWGECYRKTKR